MFKTTNRAIGKRVIAAAVALTIPLAGVAVPGTPLDVAAVASAAELDASVVTSIDIVAENGTSLKDFPDEFGKGDDAIVARYNEAFKNKRATLHVGLTIPDSARPGDTLKLGGKSGFENTVSGTSTFYVENNSGENVAVAQVAITRDLTFRLLEGATQFVNREVSFTSQVELPEAFTKVRGQKKFTNDPSLDGTVYQVNDVQRKIGVFYNRSVPLLIKTNKYERTQYYEHRVHTDDYKFSQQRNWAAVYEWDASSLDKGTSSIRTLTWAGMGFPEVTNKTDPKPDWNFVHDRSVPEKRDITYTFNVSIKDPGSTTFRPVVDGKDGFFFTDGEWSNNTNQKLSPKWIAEVNSLNTKFYNYKYGEPLGDVRPVIEPGIYPCINGECSFVARDVPRDWAFTFPTFEYVANYVPGATIRIEAKKPQDNYVAADPGETETYTFPIISGFAAGDHADAKLKMKVKANGQEADTAKDAALVTGGKANYTAVLRREGNIGLTHVDIQYPDGVTGPNGETHKVHTFRDGMAAYRDYEIDLGELNVAENAGSLFEVVRSNNNPTGREISDHAYVTHHVPDAPIASNAAYVPIKVIEGTTKSSKLTPEYGGISGTIADAPAWLTVGVDGTVTAAPVKGSGAEYGTEKQYTVHLTTPQGEQEKDVPVSVTVYPAYDADYPEVTAPGGSETIIPPTEDAPDGYTFAPGPGTPDWVEVDPDTGTLTVNPPLGKGDTTVTVVVTDPLGGTTTVTVPVKLFNDYYATGVSEPTAGHYVISLNNDESVEVDLSGTPSSLELKEDGTLVIISADGKETVVGTIDTLTPSVVVEDGETKLIFTNQNGERAGEVTLKDNALESIEALGDGNYRVHLKDGETIEFTISGDINAALDELEQKVRDAGAAKNLSDKQLREELLAQVTTARDEHLRELDKTNKELEQGVSELDKTLDDTRECLQSTHVVVPSVIAAIAGLVSVFSALPPSVMRQLGSAFPDPLAGIRNTPQGRAMEQAVGPAGVGVAALAGIAGLLGLLFVPGVCESGSLADGSSDTE